MKLSTFGVIFAGATAFVLSAEPVHAASIVCPTAAGSGFSAPIWDNVTPNTGINGCELGSVNNDSVTSVNTTDSMFGITNWALLGGTDLNSTSGTISWSSSLYAGLTINNLMLVLKGGAEALPQNPGPRLFLVFMWVICFQLQTHF